MTPVRSPVGFASALMIAALVSGEEVRAETTADVDVSLHEAPEPHRGVALSFNPLPLLVGRVSADIVVVPRNHHALVVSPFFVSTSTAAIYVFDDRGNPTQLPAQTFSGWGGELGYRYYFQPGGARGLFLGPSLVLGRFRAKAQNGSSTPYGLYGGAADVGYQTLVAERVSLGLGAGLQLTGTSKAIPEQQFPARYYANGGVAPRVLASIGVAF